MAEKLSPKELNALFVQHAFEAVNQMSPEGVTCAQVGACDGKRWDPVFKQVTTHGWTLYPMEPHPVYFDQLSKNYQEYENVKPIQIAISEEPGEMLLYHASRAAAAKFPPWLQGCSSLRVQRMNLSVTEAVRVSKKPRQVHDISATRVPIVRLETVLKNEGVEKLNVLVIDTEGHELSVMNSLDPDVAQVEVAVIECNGMDFSKQQDYVNSISNLQLRVWRIGDDLWGVHDRLFQSSSFDDIRDLLTPTELIAKPKVPAAAAAQETPADADDTLQPVPKKLGHIWIGYKRAPEDWMKTWRDAHPDWEYQVFDNDYLFNRDWKNKRLIAEYVRRGRFEGASDLMRYEILYEQGGFIPEADSTCQQNTEVLFTLPSLYTVYEHEVSQPGFVSPFLASSPKHPFLKKVIDHLHETQTPETLQGPFRSVGNKFLGEIIEQEKPEISILPSYFFIPNHLRSGKSYTEGPVFADQLWGSSNRGYGDHTLDKTAALSGALYEWSTAVLKG